MRQKRRETGNELIGLADMLARSGIPKLLLHAWERRYGLEPSERSPTGRRFYTLEQAERLRLLKACSDGGHRISSLVSLPIDQLRRLEAELAARRALGELIDAVRSMDSDRLQALLQDRAKRQGPAEFIRATALPLMRDIGSRWAEKELTVAAEHMATAEIKRIIGGLFDRCPPPPPDARRLVATTPEGEEHDIGAQVATLIGRLQGWNALFLGAKLPTEDIAEAAHMRGASCVCLSAVNGRKAGLERQLRALRSALSPKIDIWIGGSAYRAMPPMDGVTFMVDFDMFAEALASTAGLQRDD
jgi:methanogenic corrinoid protein MtbC1